MITELSLKLSIERAALMASFCEWAVTFDTQNSEQQRLVEVVVNGLGRLQVRMSAKNDAEMTNGHLINV